MTLVEMQACLARLYVNEGFRRWFAASPEAAVAGYELTAAEAEALRALDPTEVAMFASTLVTKRMRRAQRAYSGSFAWHGEVLERTFRRFVEMHGAPLQPTVHHDTVAFGRFAEQTLLDPERFPAAVAELIRFERLAYEATFLHDEVPDGPAGADPVGPGTLVAVAPGVQVGDFTVDVVELDAQLREESRAASEPGGPADLTEAAPVDREPPRPDVAPEPRPMDSTIVFRPGRSVDGQRMLRLNGPPAVLLGLCDGRRDAATIVHLVEVALAAPDLEVPVLDALHRLRDAGILTTAGR